VWLFLVALQPTVKGRACTGTVSVKAATTTAKMEWSGWYTRHCVAGWVWPTWSMRRLPGSSWPTTQDSYVSL